MDWDRYDRYRPKYPASLVKLVMEFQRAHSNAFRFAHDVGSGSGVFAPNLAEYFQHVHVSDPKAGFIEQARERLDVWFEKHWWKGRFTFTVTPAEKAGEIAAKRSVDLVTLMQCAHWTDQDDMVRSVAASLTPNGTMALVHIHPEPTVVGNDAVSTLVRRLFEFWVENIIEAAGGTDSKLYKSYLPQSNAALESVHLPEDLFIQDVTKRIYINVRGQGSSAFIVSGSEGMVADSRASPQHRRYEYSSDDSEGTGWRYDVEGSWFRGYISTLVQEGSLGEFEEHFKDIETAVNETSPNGKVTVEWPVAVLFATRK